MTSKFHIKEAGLKEIPVIQEIARQSWYSTYQGILSIEQIQYLLTQWYSKEFLEKEIQKHKNNHYLLFEKDEAFGFFAFFQNKENHAIMRLSRIYLIPEFQKKGYGKSVISFLESEAEKINCRFIELNVSKDNSAISFYKKMGFKIEKDENVQIGPYSFHDHVMMKELKK